MHPPCHALLLHASVSVHDQDVLLFLHLEKMPTPGDPALKSDHPWLHQEVSSRVPCPMLFVTLCYDEVSTSVSPNCTESFSLVFMASWSLLMPVPSWGQGCSGNRYWTNKQINVLWPKWKTMQEGGNKISYGFGNNFILVFKQSIL